MMDFFFLFLKNQYFIFEREKLVKKKYKNKKVSNMDIKKLIANLLVVISFICAFSSSCSKISESQQLDEKIFIPVYCDVVTYADLLDAKTREVFVDSVLNHYQITREQFQATVDAYSHNDKKWEKIMTKIVKELERREKETTAEMDSIKTTK